MRRLTFGIRFVFQTAGFFSQLYGFCSLFYYIFLYIWQFLLFNRFLLTDEGGSKNSVAYIRGDAQTEELCIPCKWHHL